VDFKAIYYSSRCLIEHRNPYRQVELEAVYRAESGERPSEIMRLRQAVTLCINLPATIILIAPIAMLSWEPALLLWITLTAVSLIFAAFLMCDLGAGYAPNLSLFLIVFLLANCELIFYSGNASGIVVSLCLVAVWCFLTERFVWAGVLCLAVSLATKPHDAGFIWLYFLLAGGVHRKRALQTLLVTAVLGLAAILWVTPISPHWISELHSNLLATSGRGGINELGPAPWAGYNAGMVICLQSVVSVFCYDPRIYNAVSYLVCGALLLAWSVRTLRSPFTLRGAWLALAAVLPLTLLVTYHRPWDAKLLMFSVPACAMLWAEGRPIRWVALLVTTAAIVFTADIPLIILFSLTQNLHITTVGLPGELLTVVLMRPTPLMLLAMGIFYLWVYVRRDPSEMQLHDLESLKKRRLRLRGHSHIDSGE
jgi:hypothetical protein